MLLADDQIEIAIAIQVDESGSAGLTHRNSAKRVGGTRGLLHIASFGGCTDVQEVAQRPVALADGQVEVAIIIEVGKRWSGITTNVCKRICGSKHRRGDGADIDEIIDVAFPIPTMASRSPSPSRSAKVGALSSPTSKPSNGLAAPVCSESRRDGRAGVLEIDQDPIGPPTTASRSPSPSRSASWVCAPHIRPLNGLAAPVC